MRKKFLLAPAILIILLSFFAWRPLLNPGYFSMHDDQQIVRLQQLDKSLRAGQFPVRWVADLGFGYGYPLFNFYPPLVYYLGEIFHLSGLGFINSIKLVWFAAIVGSGLAMYFLAKEFFGKAAGLVAAAFYVYAPYHAVDAYVRGALAELFSFVWLPLILWTVYKKRPVWAGIFLGLLMITHNLIFLPFFGFFIVWAFIFNKRAIFISTLVAFGTMAFFWLPALTEKQFTLVDQLLIKNLASYRIHFVCLPQLWNSLWGFGGSGSGCLDGLSFKIGKLHIVTALITPVLVFYFWLRGSKKMSMILASLFLFLVLSVFMTTEYSRMIWDNIPQLWYLQFPWRFLEFTALFSSLLAGSVLAISQGRVKYILGILLIVGVIYFNAKYFQPQYYYPAATDRSLTSDERIKWDISATSFEYLPAGMATKIAENGTLWVDINQNQVSSIKYQVLRGDFKIEEERFAPHKFRITGRSGQGATLQVNITNFPGWKVWVDGRETEISDQNPYKLITVTVPAGSHKITGEFTNTSVRNWGNIISLTTLTVLAGIFLYDYRRNKK